MLNTGFVTAESRAANLGASFRHLITNAVALDDDRIKTSYVATAGTKVSHVTADFAAQPDVSRNVIFKVTAVGGTVAGVWCKVKGTDPDGNHQEELLKVSGIATATGKKMFKTISSAETLCRGTPASTATSRIGVGNSLYPGVKLGAAADITLVTQAGTPDTVTVSARYSSFIPATVPDGTIDYEVFGRSTWGLDLSSVI